MYKEDCKSCAKITCRVHPNYQAKRKPRCNCKECWDIWNKKNNKTTKEEIQEALDDVRGAIQNLKGQKLTEEEKKKLKEEFDALDKSMMDFFDIIEKRNKEKENGQK
jgi:DNA gyrase/topoisomerase IV subunit A